MPLRAFAVSLWFVPAVVVGGRTLRDKAVPVGQDLAEDGSKEIAMRESREQDLASPGGLDADEIDPNQAIPGIRA